MLEKNSNFSYFDAHFHVFDCLNLNCYDNSDIQACSCAHSQQEFQIQIKHKELVQSYGLHPQSAGNKNPMLQQENLEFLEKLLEQNLISAIGETGFDFYTQEFKQNADIQEALYIEQIELAIKYKKPVIIHCRKANSKLFQYSKQLSKLPAVLFHSFMGTFSEAETLISRNINCYFSFGKQIFNGNKKVIECVTKLPHDRLLLETDAPFQTLKGEAKTFSSEIKKIYEGAFSLRQTNFNHKKSYEEFCSDIKQNFHSLYNL